MGGANLKIAIIAGGLAWLASFLPGVKPKRDGRNLVLLTLAAMVAYLVLRSLFVANPLAAAVEVATMAIKVCIFWGVVRLTRDRKSLDVVLTAFIWGGLFAALFGVYQLVAFYLHWPQVVGYDGIGGAGGLGRIASFSYEPAYFGYFLLLVVGVLYARARFRRAAVPLAQLGILLLVLVMVNSRGTYLLLPIILVACAVWDTSVMARSRQLAVLGTALVLMIASAVLFPQTWLKALRWIASSLDPTEPWSNAVRLELYHASLRVIATSPWLGVGPGQFFDTARGLGLDPAGSNSLLATANNNWLQAMLDGGVPLVILTLAFVILIAVRYVIVASPATRNLAAAYLTVVLGAGMLVTNLFDAKMMFVLGFVIGLERLSHSTSLPAHVGPAHIGIDARTISSSTGRYIERVLAHLQMLDSMNTYTVMLKSEGEWTPQASNFNTVVADFPNHSLREQWSFWLFLRRQPFDLVHYPMPQQPLLYGRPRVTTFQDLTLLKVRNPRKSAIVGWVKRFVGREVLQVIARRTDALIVPSAYTRQEVEAFAGRDADDCTLIYDAAEVETGVPRALDLPFDRFLLYVGNQIEYKNTFRLAEAHHVLRQTHPDLGLVFVGRLDEAALAVQAQIEERNYEGILFTGRIDDDQRDWLYGQCAVFVFPSLLEGFGLPGLEAMLRDAPVVSSRATCLPEVYGAASLYFDPLDVQSMAACIESVLSSPEIAAQLREIGHERVAQFSWNKTARETLAVYQSVLAGKPVGRGEDVKE